MPLSQQKKNPSYNQWIIKNIFSHIQIDHLFLDPLDSSRKNFANVFFVTKKIIIFEKRVFIVFYNFNIISSIRQRAKR